MPHHFEQLTQDADIIAARYRLNANHPCFAGHFPDSPILPAVAQLQILEALLTEATGKRQRIQAAGNIKYLHPLVPNDLLKIELHHKSNGFSFRILANDTLASQGNIEAEEESA